MKKYLGLSIVLVMVIVSGFPRVQTHFGKIPVVTNGRIQPIESVARNSLLIIHGKQTLNTMSASEWMLSLLSNSAKTDKLPLFLINNPEVKTYLGFKDEKQKYFSFNALQPRGNQIITQAEKAEQIDAQLRSAFQKEIVALKNRISLYYRLKNSLWTEDVTAHGHYLTHYQDIIPKGMPLFQDGKKGTSPKQKAIQDEFAAYFKTHHFLSQLSYFWVIPGDEGWMSLGKGMLLMLNKDPHPLIPMYAEMLDSPTPENVNKIVGFSSSFRTNLEYYFDHFQPFYKAMILYLVVFILVMISVVKWKRPLETFAFQLLVFTFGLHTLGLVVRMVIQGRPPVTNLYSSAIFVGWFAILLGILLEKRVKNKLGIMVSGLVGFSSLIIAHHLSTQGDTLEMMQAVLDSNFWLATHVVTITMGYGAAFLAGLMGGIHVIQQLFGKQDSDTPKMVVGTICFALLFSFVGTVLGGIWADQSWGRFWGWDPKENGALLIVIWNAIILHTRMAGWINVRGLMVMAIFGNIVTAFSWFGVNMLGIGLHSYGFMDKAFFWLVVFSLSQVILMGLAFVPSRKSPT